MDRFLERASELAKLQRALDRVESGGRGGRPGRAVLLRGRRRVGKSRLVEEFVRRADVPHLFHCAAPGRGPASSASCWRRAPPQDCPADRPWPGGRPARGRRRCGSWRRRSPRTPRRHRRGRVPHLLASDPDLEGVLQLMFARELSRRPVLLILVGSDSAAMEAINQPGRPFYMRAAEMVLHPLTPADLAATLELPAAEAVDAHLVSGGLPMICARWPRGSPSGTVSARP
nr:hypothetical protein GCM10020093_090750 [Planobispora longispora]